MQNLIKSAALGAVVFVAACESEQAVLPGERLGIRDLETVDYVAPVVTENQVRDISFGAAVNNAAWAQGHGTPRNRVDHPALGASPKQVWTSSIGRGDGRRVRITAAPVVADGRVYTLDSGATVTATSLSGETVWQRNLTPLRDGDKDADGGALAFEGGRLFVTSGFGHLSALDAATGDEVWTQKLRATGTGVPTIYDGVVYLVAGDTTAWAIEADTGRVRWQIDALSDVNNVTGGAAPALTDQRAIFAFGSGELQATFRQGGLRIWGAALVGQRAGSALATVEDVTGDPIVVGDTVYTANSSGRTVALSLGDGSQKWAAPHGSFGQIWVGGGSVFLVSDQNKLVRLDANDGSQIWAVDLPVFIKPNRVKRRAERHAHHGPIVAGGRVWVASSDGEIRGFDPASGEQVASLPIQSGATSDPVVAGQTLFVVSSRGVLHAYR